MIDPLIWQILLQIILIGLNAVFACAEIAVISMNDTYLERLADQGDKRAGKLVKLTAQPARFLATIQVAITLSGFLGSAFAADNFSEPIVNWLVSMNVPVPLATLDTICVVFITIVLSYFTLVFGELVPKRLAMKNKEALALGMAGMLTTISGVFRPLVAVLTVSTNAVLRLCGIDPNAEDEEVTEEEIRIMIDVGSEKGTIDEDEKEILQNVFEFDNVTAGEIATHRTKVNNLWLEDTDEQWEETIRASQHIRYPICGENADQIVGILNTGVYFRLQDRSRKNVMAHAVSKPQFVPMSIKADDLFAEMKKHREQFAVVVDEYGGVEGIVTMNDLIEEVMGDLTGEASTIVAVDEDTWRISGETPLDEVADELDVELPLDDFDTLGGLAMSTQSIVPQDGEKFECEISGLQIRVERIEGHMVKSALVRKLSTAEEQ